MLVSLRTPFRAMDEDLQTQNNGIATQRLPNPHLCTTCRELFIIDGAYTKLASKKGIKIRTKRSALEDTALNGCWLCKRILKVVDDPDSSIKASKPSPGLNLNKKSIRKLGPINFSSLSIRRDSEVAIRFRQELRSPHIVTCKRSEQWHSSEKIDFEIFAKHDDLAGRHISNRAMNSRLIDQGTYEKIRNWLEDCDSSHLSCRRLYISSGYSRSPTRLLNISEERLVRVQLVPNGETLRYAALSYCWGQNQVNVLTTATEEAYFKGIDPSWLPQTLRHAVFVTRMLGLQYLWIDSLCILQDSEADKAQEIGKMDSIYFNAYVTISASCVRSCHDSILHDRDFIWDLHDFPFKCDDGQVGTTRLAASGNKAVIAAEKHRQILDPINSRAWTFQESFLSRRLLIFSTYQLFWVCGELWKSDGGRMLRPQYFQKESSCRVRGSVSLPDWLDVVEEYSARSLSDPNDKLPALSSIASYFAQQLQLKDQYVVGMWLQKLPYQLCWSASTSGPVKSGYRASSWQRPSQWRAPSWSFLSIDSLITFDRLPWRDASSLISTEFMIVCSVVSTKIVPIFEQAPFGRIKTGSSLTLRGRVWQLKPRRRDTRSNNADNTFDLSELPRPRKVKRPKISSIGFLWYDTLEKAVGSAPERIATCYGAFLDPEEPVWCIPLYTEKCITTYHGENVPDSREYHHCGLALSKLPDGRYHRLGLFEWVDSSIMKELGYSESSKITRVPEQDIDII